MNISGSFEFEEPLLPLRAVYRVFCAADPFHSAIILFSCQAPELTLQEACLTCAAKRFTHNLV